MSFKFRFTHVINDCCGIFFFFSKRSEKGSLLFITRNSVIFRCAPRGTAVVTFSALVLFRVRYNLNSKVTSRLKKKKQLIVSQSICRNFRATRRRLSDRVSVHPSLTRVLRFIKSSPNAPSSVHRCHAIFCIKNNVIHHDFYRLFFDFLLWFYLRYTETANRNAEQARSEMVFRDTVSSSSVFRSFLENSFETLVRTEYNCGTFFRQ